MLYVFICFLFGLCGYVHDFIAETLLYILSDAIIIIYTLKCDYFGIYRAVKVVLNPEI